VVKGLIAGAPPIPHVLPLDGASSILLSGKEESDHDLESILL